MITVENRPFHSVESHMLTRLGSPELSNVLSSLSVGCRPMGTQNPRLQRSKSVIGMFHDLTDVGNIAFGTRLLLEASQVRGLQRYGLFTLVLLFSVANTTAHAQFSVLYNFGSNSHDPMGPTGVIAQGRDGSLYSSTGQSVFSHYAGTVFKITPAGALTSNLVDIRRFGVPNSGLTLGSDGNFYGTTDSLVFKTTQTLNLTMLYAFTGNDGRAPQAPPIQATDGNLYGTTYYGGANGLGTVYKLTRSGNLTTLYSFDTTHGNNAVAPLVQGTDDNFYGVTSGGGTNDWGVVYEITAGGKFTVIYYFDGTHGGQSVAPLVQGTDGNFYGTTQAGGSKSAGVVFKVTPTGKLTVLHNLNGTTDGSRPFGGLVQATDGNFYGAAFGSGIEGGGTIFRISPTKPYAYKVLYNFDGTHGTAPMATLLQHTNGILYGDTFGGGTGSFPAGVFYSLNLNLGPFVSLVSTSGKVGKTIGILGQGFRSSSIVKFDGVQATSVKPSGTTFLSVTVPSGALTGSVTVTTGSTTLTSNKVFRVTPQILSFSPTSGSVGTPVTITGVSLTQTTKVTFGEVKATRFTANSDTQVTATVPTGAVTGHIAITTAGGTAESSGIFTVTQ